MMKFDPNSMGYTFQLYQTKGNFMNYKWCKLWIIKLISLKVVIDLVTKGKLKFSQKFILRLALTLKPYNIEC